MKAETEHGILTSRPVRVAVDPVHPDFPVILETANIIRQGGVVAYPTETYYGLAVDPFNGTAVRRLFEIKGRPTGQPLILLISQTGQLLDLARATGLTKEWCEKLTRAFWPGPLTLVLPVRPRLVCPALAGGDTVAVRLSSNPVAWQLARTFGLPITSTSANLSGGAPATSASSIDPALAQRLDRILDAGESPGGPPSTILDLTGTRPVILRQGAITAERIASVITLRPREAAGKVA